MSLDYNESVKEAQKKIKSAKTYRAVSDDIKSLKQNTADNLEQNKQDVLTTLNNAKDAKKKVSKTSKISI